METINSHEYKTSIEELFSGLSSEERYDHLKLFLSREKSKHKLPMCFLYISRTAFGKVLLDDVDFDGRMIQLSIEDCSTGFKKVIFIDISDKEFQFLMILWDDIRSMVQAENKSISNFDGLLDFE